MQINNQLDGGQGFANGAAAAAVAGLTIGKFTQRISWTNSSPCAATGTASYTTQDYSLDIFSGATAGSRIGVQLASGIILVNMLGAGFGKFDADKPFTVSFLVSCIDATADGIGRAVFGKIGADANGDLSFAGFGIKILNRRLWGVLYDTSLKTVDLGVDLSSDLNSLISINRTATGIDYYIDGTLRGTIATAGIGLLKTYTTPRFETDNGATAASNRFMVSPVEILC